MRILLYSISFSPEVAGSGRFNGELTEWLAAKGYQVDVITAHPYYPEWKVRDSYKGKGWFVERSGSLSVYRTPLYVPNKVTGSTRIVHELSFAANSLLHWARLLFNRYDAIVGICPPLQAGLLPYFFSVIKQTPFIFHIQDLQVDTAKNLGLINNKFLLNFLDKIERFLLKKATIVSSISEGMKRNILSKGVKEDRYRMVPNWVNIKDFYPEQKDDLLLREFGFSVGDKIALYAGNIGEKQGLEVLIEAAVYLKEFEEIKILVVGEGAARKRLEAAAAQKQLNNIYFSSFRPYDQMPKILSLADIHLVVQKRAASDLVMPSKLVGILASGGVSIVSADSGTSLSDIIINNKLGWVVEPEKGDLLAQKIVDSLKSPHIYNYRLNARRYAEENLSEDAVLPLFEKIIMEVSESN